MEPKTYRDLARWLRTLTNAQLDAPVLVSIGADDLGHTVLFPVVDLVDRPQLDARFSGGYASPVLLIMATYQQYS